MKKKIEDLKVIKNEQLNRDYFLLELGSQVNLPIIQPGQFVELEIANSKNTFLRRPFSIHDVNEKNNSLILLIRLVGDGTKELSKSKVGDYISTIYPLGKGFNHSKEKEVLLIGGGCGVAPMLYFAKTIKEKDIIPNVLMGFRTKDDIVRYDEYKKYGNIYVTTEDNSFGSEGERGYVTNHSILKNKKFDKIYVCGPEIMMKAVAKYANEKNMECEVSLENLMACGIGACLCCVTDTIAGRKCACTEGPVFNIKELDW